MKQVIIATILATMASVYGCTLDRTGEGLFGPGGDAGGGEAGGGDAGGADAGGGGSGGDACMPTDEVCGDDTDNDCDGDVDEDCDCNPGDSQECGSDVGECANGTQSCGDDGMWGACEGATDPATEICDGLDNDCDGTDDNGFPDLGDACDEGVGECLASGQMVCNQAGNGTECSAVAGSPMTEICDGLDNNCDGNDDEGNTCLVSFGPDNSGCYEALLIEPVFMPQFAASSTLNGSCFSGTVTGIPMTTWSYLLWEDDTVIEFDSPMAVISVEGKCSQYATPATNANMATEFSLGNLTTIPYSQVGDTYTLDAPTLSGLNCSNGTYYIEINF